MTSSTSSDRRDHRPRGPAAGDDEAARRRQLVPAELAALAAPRGPRAPRRRRAAARGSRRLVAAAQSPARGPSSHKRAAASPPGRPRRVGRGRSSSPGRHLIRGEALGWTSAAVLTLLGIGLALLAAFARWAETFYSPAVHLEGQRA